MREHPLAVYEKCCNTRARDNPDSVLGRVADAFQAYGDWVEQLPWVKDKKCERIFGGGGGGGETGAGADGDSSVPISPPL